MTFPAWDSFESDENVNMRHVKVYRWCRKHLDFTQVRYGKRESIAKNTGLHVADVTRALRALVDWGYLCEHPHEPKEARRFTLCWSKGDKSPPITSASEEVPAA